MERRREKWERVGEKEGGREEREGEIGRLEIYREGRGGDRVEERERGVKEGREGEEK